MSRVTYECDDGNRFIFLTDSRGNEMVDWMSPGWSLLRLPIGEFVKIMQEAQKRREAKP